MTAKCSGCRWACTNSGSISMKAPSADSHPNPPPHHHHTKCRPAFAGPPARRSATLLGMLPVANGQFQPRTGAERLVAGLLPASPRLRVPASRRPCPSDIPTQWNTMEHFGTLFQVFRVPPAHPATSQCHNGTHQAPDVCHPPKLWPPLNLRPPRRLPEARETAPLRLDASLFIADTYRSRRRKCLNMSHFLGL